MKRTVLSLLLASLMLITNVGNVKAAENTMPKIEGKAGIVIDMDTKEIIYANNIDGKQWPASTTKLLTGLLFAESKKRTDAIPYSQSASIQPEYSLGKTLARGKMKVGDTMSAQDVMDALLIYSANDSAYMVADAVSGDSNKFAELMNDRIKKLGLQNTHFIIPNGLDHPEHYTTPYDLSVIGREAFKNEWVRETLAKKGSTISTSTGVTMMIENRNKLLELPGWQAGGKTGLTDLAGRSFVAFYEKDGRKLVGVVMKSVYGKDDTAVFEDMKKIVEWSLTQKPAILHKSGDTLKTETISYKPFRFFGPEKTIQVPLLVKDDISYYDNDVNKKELKEEYNIEKLNVWKLDSEKPAGTLAVKEREAVKNINLYTTISTKDIVKDNIVLYLVSALGVIIVVLALMILILKLKHSRRKNSKRYY
ncbi:D-alanyl-D-alanine carboxypeptidase [Clostridium swellfunianum]|uniref:D-alanyl-D-alanine carboxypeptidase family protein n=1 Tax=Clostridium swellfunianum TaxID=1367462 RepID=UPI0020306318|nr:serine hydrolase [Clostridium swellfunianum]MCM0648334.1 D-alanyl-D-alanine carboxypeptidase [Clostridium swellfunianum]